MTRHPAPSPPFIPARYKGGPQKPKAIVIHATVSSDNKGTARNIAQWWASDDSPQSSAHYTVDPGEVIQSVGDHTIAFHCGYNEGSIGVEFCDEQTGPAARWADADSKAILRRGARLVAELCLAYKISVKRPSIGALKARGPHGIYGHNDSRLAFGHTTHTDPREFPWDEFMRMVREETKKLTTPEKKAERRRQFKILHAPLHGSSATQAEIRRALNRPGVVGVDFSEAYRHIPFLRRLTGWRTTSGAAGHRDAKGRQVRRDIAISVRRFRKPIESGVMKASEAAKPLRIAPERWLAYTIDNVAGKPLAHIALHPNAAIRSNSAWNSPRGREYRAAMETLRDLVVHLREKYGDDLDIVVSGDLQYTKGDPKRKWSPAWVFDELDLNWVASGIDWVAYSSGLRLTNTTVVPKEVNGQDHIWLEATFMRA